MESATIRVRELSTTWLHSVFHNIGWSGLEHSRGVFFRFMGASICGLTVCHATCCKRDVGNLFLICQGYRWLVNHRRFVTI